MTQPIVAMAKDLVMALIQANFIAPEDMTQELEKTHANLTRLKAQEDGTDKGQINVGTWVGDQIDWKKSIKKHSIECLVCGAVFKQLSAHHLSTHDLDPQTYRQQFGIPSTQSLAAKATTELRKQVVQRVRPWEKAPTYGKATAKTSTSGKAAPAKRTRKKAAAAASR